MLQNRIAKLVLLAEDVYPQHHGHSVTLRPAFRGNILTSETIQDGWYAGIVYNVSTGGLDEMGELQGDTLEAALDAAEARLLGIRRGSE